MNSKLNPYINFKGQAKEAMAFYKTVFGGNLTMSTFGESGVPADQAPTDQIMHSALVIDEHMQLMASDTPSHMPYTPGTNVSLSLSGEDEAELKGYWDKLSEGAQISAPLNKAPWGDTFGMLTDKFGVHWLVNITAKK